MEEICRWKPLSGYWNDLVLLQQRRKKRTSQILWVKKNKRDLASCGAIGGQFGQNITTRELFYSPMGFYCSRRFMSVVPSETIPRHSQYLAHTDSHNQRAVSAVLSLRRLTYLGCRFTCGFRWLSRVCRLWIRPEPISRRTGARKKEPSRQPRSQGSLQPALRTGG